MLAPKLLEKSTIRPIIHWTKKVPENKKTLRDVRDFPARWEGKFKAIAGWVKDITIEDKMYKANIVAPAFSPIKININKTR